MTNNTDNLTTNMEFKTKRRFSFVVINIFMFLGGIEYGNLIFFIKSSEILVKKLKCPRKSEKYLVNTKYENYERQLPTYVNLLHTYN